MIYLLHDKNQETCAYADMSISHLAHSLMELFSSPADSRRVLKVVSSWQKNGH